MYAYRTRPIPEKRNFAVSNLVLSELQKLVREESDYQHKCTNVADDIFKIFLQHDLVLDKNFDALFKGCIAKAPLEKITRKTVTNRIRLQRLNFLLENTFTLSELNNMHCGDYLSESGILKVQKNLPDIKRWKKEHADLKGTNLADAFNRTKFATQRYKDSETYTSKAKRKLQFSDDEPEPTLVGKKQKENQSNDSITRKSTWILTMKEILNALEVFLFDFKIEKKVAEDSLRSIWWLNELALFEDGIIFGKNHDKRFNAVVKVCETYRFSSEHKMQMVQALDYLHFAVFKYDQRYLSINYQLQHVLEETIVREYDEKYGACQYGPSGSNSVQNFVANSILDLNK